MNTFRKSRACRPLVCALASTVIAVGWPCQAAITYVDPDDITIPTTFGGVYLDLDSGAGTPSSEGGSTGDESFTISFAEPAGSWDVNFFFGGAAIAHSDSFNPYRAGGGTDNTSAIRNLGIGTVIDGAPGGGSQPLASAAFGASGAFPADPHMGTAPLEFTNGADGYIGFLLDESTSPLYGWMRVEFHDDGSPGLIKEWAYSDQPIEIGQVPEPSVFALCTLGLAGLLAARRRSPANGAS